MIKHTDGLMNMEKQWQVVDYIAMAIMAKSEKIL
jgi:hypothetical protein